MASAKHLEKQAKKAKRQAERREADRQKQHAHAEAAWWDADKPLQPPIDLAAERHLRTLAWHARNPTAISDTAAADLADGSWQDLHADMIASDPLELAQELLYQASESDWGDHADDLVEKALELDDDCLDAMGFRGWIADPLERSGNLARYCARPHVAAALAQVQARSPDRPAWQDALIRPVVRFLQRLLPAYAQSPADATEATWTEGCRLAAELERIDPELLVEYADFQLCWLLALGRLPEALALIERHSQFENATWRWARTLALHLGGDLRAARSAYEEAIAYSSDARATLLAVPSTDAEDDEPQDCPTALRLAWQRNPSALAWLAAGARILPPEALPLALASYAAPVAELLSLGPFDDTERTRPAAIASRLGLTEAHLPELRRMADDQALHEADPACDASLAPLHALEQLAIHPHPDSADFLVALVARRGFDDWTMQTGPTALVAHGAWTGAGVVRLLEDPQTRPCQRPMLCEVLGKIGSHHPAQRPAIIAALMGQLSRYAETNPDTNAIAAHALADLGATEASELVQQAFAAQAIDTWISGDWKEWQKNVQSAKRH